ncbi:nitrous oxide reductase accessory protein NosL [Roseivirga echinicomitans]
MHRIGWLLLLTVFVFSCEVKPQEIAYGADGCHFCKMTIVDTRHAAQLVTEKGKAFKYDAIECMVNDLAEWDEVPVKFFLVVDYSNPKTLMNAHEAHYLISEAIPSPMGENLSAFSSAQMRDEFLESKGGKAFNWESLKAQFNQK